MLKFLANTNPISPGKHQPYRSWQTQMLQVLANTNPTDPGKHQPYRSWQTLMLQSWQIPTLQDI